MSEQLAPSERHEFLYKGRVVYEWDQTFSEVNIYITVPEGVRARQLDCEIAPKHVRVGIKPNPPYIDEDLTHLVKVSESFWTLEDGVLHITLQKAEEGEPWTSALLGHALDPMKAEDDRKRLLLERFQQEHPGFDFSGAGVTGSNVPNPRTFMKEMADE